MNRLPADQYFTAQQDYFCFITSLNPKTEPKTHNHEFYEIEIILRGVAEDTINGKGVLLKEGDLFVLRPWDIHGIHAAHENTELVNLAFSVELMHEILNFLDLESIDKPLKGNLPTDFLFLLPQQIEKLSSSTQPHSRSRAMLKELITICIYSCHLQRMKKDIKVIPPWVKQLIQKMDTPQGLVGGVEYLKKQTNYSYPHICRCFKKYTGKTPVEWINQQRLIYSARLLNETEQSVLNIALECGFNNLSHFNHLFKTFYGVTPSAYRKAIVNILT